ncbi:Hypothetical protein, partial CDS, partial [Neorhizobium galegae bv. officinalis]
MNIGGADSKVYCVAGKQGGAFAQQYCQILILRPDGYYLRARPRWFNYRDTGGNTTFRDEHEFFRRLCALPLQGLPRVLWCELHGEVTYGTG